MEFREANTASGLGKGVALKGGGMWGVKEKLYKQEKEPGRVPETGSSLAEQSSSPRPPARGPARTPASWLITSVHPAKRGDECLAHLPSALIKGQSWKENSL